MSEAGKDDGNAVRRCPTCGKPTVHAFRPFCSKRCADVDLHRWLGGVYAVPSQEEEAPDDPGPAKEQ